MTGKRPGTRREYLAALRSAYRAEEMSGGGQMSGAGTCSGRGDVGGILMSGGGSKSWRGRFHVYISTGARSVIDGDWAYPLRSSLSRMGDSPSDVDRLAAFYLFLLVESRFHARSAFAKLIGPSAHQEAIATADSWSAEALRRWWPYYVELPSGDRRSVGPSERRTFGPSA